MKPLVLNMQAFGPFPTQQSINFTLLGEHPLFLINGATGAGKTTLLDAISFALYGETTGQDRIGKQMRCDHAADDCATEVEFIFAVGEKTYRVMRQPTQHILGQRGNSKVERRTTASLYQLQGEWSNDQLPNAMDWQPLETRKVTEVNKHIETLLGLRAEQFRQVVVLPQGKFRELLNADANERETILSQLFQTQRFKRYEELFKQQASELKKSFEQLEQQKAHILDGSECEDLTQLEQHIADLKPQLEAKQTVLNQLQQQINDTDYQLKQQHTRNAKYKDLQHAKHQQDALKAKQADIDYKQQQIKAAQAAIRLLPTYNEWQQNEKHVKTSQEKQLQLETRQQQQAKTLKVAQTSLQEAKTKLEQNHSLRTTLQRLEELLPTVEQLEGLTKQVEQHQSKLALQEKEGKQLRASYDAVQLDIKRLRSEQLQVQSKIDELPELEVRVQALSEQRKQLLKKQQLTEQATTVKNDQAKLQHALEKRLDDKQQAYTRANELEQRWLASQAPLLASQLKPQQPCPVCGSKQHPDPAQSDTTALVSQHELEHARATYRAAEQAFYDEQTALTKANEHERQLNQQLSEFTDLSEALIEQQEVQLNEERRTRAELLTRRQTLQSKLDQAEQQRSELEHQLEQCRAKYTEVKAQHARVNADLEHLNQRWQQSDINVAEVKPRIDQIKQQLRQLEKQFEQAQHAMQQQSEQYHATRTQLKAEVEENKRLAQALEAAEKAWQAQLASSPFATYNEFQSAHVSEPELEQLNSAVAEHNQRMVELRSMIAELQRYVDDIQPADTEQLTLRLEKLRKDFESEQTQFNQQQSALFNNEKAAQRLRQLATQNKELEAKYANIGTLANLTNGQNDQRLSLHRFILSVLLDDILIVASQHLAQMTHHRYLLVRENEVNDARSASGLNLAVTDAYTGIQRSTKTLSGGESFQAALALALGLSEVVQQYSGGIRLDMLFVDEGFGSLDEQALDAAIDVLANLRASGRSVGIISHVRELKERIDMRIDVHKGQYGSHITTRVNN